MWEDPALETVQDYLLQTILALQENAILHKDTLIPLLEQLDDYKNRDRKQNICIPEANRPQDLLPTVQGIFQLILGEAAQLK